MGARRLREMGGTIHSQFWRTSVLRRIVSAAVAGAALLAAFGCGGGGNDASVSSGAQRARRSPRPIRGRTPAVTTSSGRERRPRPSPTRACSSTCPADWPVHDLAADPTTCVRFDVHAVYLGHPGADMDCPAGLVGRADAVLVEPTEGERHRAARRGVRCRRRRRRDRDRARGAGRDREQREPARSRPTSRPRA